MGMIIVSLLQKKESNQGQLKEKQSEVWEGLQKEASVSPPLGGRRGMYALLACHCVTVGPKLC